MWPDIIGMINFGISLQIIDILSNFVDVCVGIILGIISGVTVGLLF